MTAGQRPIGLYLHIPFCDGKCPYCDFYSKKGTAAQWDAYCAALTEEIRRMGQRTGRKADTVYFGGGTPGLLGAGRLGGLLAAAMEAFQVDAAAEITVEANPSSKDAIDFEFLKAAGVNRLSVGLQSSSEEELRFLGRRHTADEALKTVQAAKKAGIDNVSLDLMLALQGQTPQKVRESVRFCKEAGASHVSAYLLKIEPSTVFYQTQKTMRLPDEDQAAELYLAASEALEQAGFFQYEISNFSVPGKESRHNLKYWDGQEYLGLGPSAHSFLEGKRFFTPGKLDAFLKEPAYCAEDAQDEELSDGGEEEYVMLRLRLTEGVTREKHQNRFGKEIPERFLKKAARFAPHGLTQVDEQGFRLTRRGFLVSNDLIGELIF